MRTGVSFSERERGFNFWSVMLLSTALLLGGIYLAYEPAAMWVEASTRTVGGKSTCKLVRYISNPEEDEEIPVVTCNYGTEGPRSSRRIRTTLNFEPLAIGDSFTCTWLHRGWLGFLTDVPLILQEDCEASRPT